MGDSGIASLKSPELPGRFSPLVLERVRWGGDLITHLHEELRAQAARRPLLVMSPSLRRQASISDSLAASVEAVAIWSGSKPHTPRETVMDLLAWIRETSCDLIITVGGGTPIDTVKVALAALGSGVTNASDLGRLAISIDADGVRHVPVLPPPPIRQIAVPTTLSGAEFSDLAGCTDTVAGLKQLVTQPKIGPAAVIFAPGLSVYTPPVQWLASGIRTVDHAVETLCSTASLPYADALAEHALRLLGQALRACFANNGDLDARLSAQHAAWMATIGLNRIPYGASHGIGHQLGAVAGVPHGFTSCVLLPHVLNFNASVSRDSQAKVAAALGCPNATAAEAVLALVRDLGLPTRLRDVGVCEDQLPTIAKTSMSNPFVQQNPRPIADELEIAQILRAAF